jgi:hypothetical protein
MRLVVLVCFFGLLESTLAQAAGTQVAVDRSGPASVRDEERYLALVKVIAEATRRVVRLDPSSFPDLPDHIQSWMREHRFTVPQSYCDSTAHNVVHGNLDENRVSDWAVLCSRADTSRIIVFWDGRTEKATTLETRADEIFIQTVTQDSAAYSRVLVLETPEKIRSRYRAWESTAPSWVHHDAIGDVYCEKASTVFYWRNGKLESLLGAD